MSNLLGGLKKVCIYDPATGDRVVLNSISSAVTQTPQEKITSETPTGVVSGGSDYSHTIGFFDADPGLLSQIEEWERDEVPVSAVYLYENAVRFWNEKTCIDGFIESQLMSARDGVSPFSVSLISARFDPDIYMGINILRASARRNVDGRTQFDINENYVPLRLSPAGDERWFSRPLIQTVTSGTQDNGHFRLPLPFPGLRIYWGWSVYTQEAGPASLVFRTFAGTQVGVESNSPVSFGVPADIPTGTFWVDFQYADNDQNGSRIELPFIRLTPGSYTSL